MKKYILLMMLLSITLLPSALRGMEEREAKIISELEKQTTVEFDLPDIEKGKTKFETKYYILPDHELPIVNVLIFIKGGDIYDPADKSGLSGLVTSMIRNGGTVLRAPDEIDQYLDRRAATITATSNPEHISISMKCLAKDFDDIFPLLLDMLFKPRFDSRRFDLISKQFIDTVKRRKDSAEELAKAGFRSLLYGKSNPWGNYPTVNSIKNITKEDLRKFHKRFFHPDKMTIGVSGDIDPKDVLRFISDYKYESEKKSAEVLVPSASPKAKDGVYIIDKESNQVVALIGHRGIYRDNPDKFAIIVMNHILGGAAFHSRLASHVRVRGGLAYTINSRFSAGPSSAPGMFKIFLATKNKSVVDAINMIQDIVMNFSKGRGITSEEIEMAKKSFVQALIFEYSTAEQIIANSVRFDYFGYPENYIEIYKKEIEEVTLDEVRDVAEKYLYPERLQIVVVGDERDVKNKLTKNFKTNELTIEE